MVVRVEGRSNSDQAPSQLSKETTNGKKNTKEVGRRNYDKDQQHRGHYQQDDEGSEFSDHRSTFPFLSPLIHIRLLIARLGNALEFSR